MGSNLSTTTKDATRTEGKSSGPSQAAFALPQSSEVGPPPILLGSNSPEDAAANIAVSKEGVVDLQKEMDALGIYIEAEASEQVEVATEKKARSYFELDLADLAAMHGLDTGSRDDRPTHRFTSGSAYTGQWKGNMRDGFGLQNWADGAVYHGEWRENKAHGKGRFTHVDGSVYIGEWQNNMAHGLGIYYQMDGPKYEGGWREDVREGPGVETSTDGSTFQGEWRNGHKQGCGVCTWAENVGEYYGAWEQSSMTGAGFYIGGDGSSYEGRWLQNALHGIGKYIWPNGQEYRGEYVSDKKQGFGILLCWTGRRYEGFWLDGKQDGPGKEVRKDGRFMHAQWAAGSCVTPSQVAGPEEEEAAFTPTQTNPMELSPTHSGPIMHSRFHSKDSTADSISREPSRAMSFATSNTSSAGHSRSLSERKADREARMKADKFAQLFDADEIRGDREIRAIAKQKVADKVQRELKAYGRGRSGSYGASPSTSST